MGMLLCDSHWYSSRPFQGLDYRLTAERTLRIARWLKMLVPMLINVFLEYVWTAPCLLDRLLATGLGDTYSSAGAHTMAVQKHHDFSYLFRFPPCLLNSLLPFWL